MKNSPILLREMLALRNDEEARGLMRFFKTGKGEYGEGDQFLGIRVPVTRALVKRLWKETTMEDLEVCIQSPWHEVRLAALLTLIQIFKHNKKDTAVQKTCIDFYLAHTDRINNWDLVDLSCYELLGTWLLDKDRTLLHDLARNGKTIWEQRIGIVTTMQFLRHGQTSDTYAIADILLHHPHDLIHKAAIKRGKSRTGSNASEREQARLISQSVGWLLREAGKRNETELIAYLDKHHTTMPRTMLRYAIERLAEPQRQLYLRKR